MYAMRRSIAILFLVVGGCAKAPNPDPVAAEAYVRRNYANAQITEMASEEPEYATVSKVSGGHRTKPSDKPIACGVRVRFTWRDGTPTTHDDWVVWLTNDHQAVDWNGNPDGDKWRQYVRSCVKK
jgi:hypothetical protein